MVVDENARRLGGLSCEGDVGAPETRIRRDEAEVEVVGAAVPRLQISRRPTPQSGTEETLLETKPTPFKWLLTDTYSS